MAGKVDAVPTCPQPAAWSSRRGTHRTGSAATAAYLARPRCHGLLVLESLRVRKIAFQFTRIAKMAATIVTMKAMFFTISIAAESVDVMLPRFVDCVA